jgi:hypothetical protein
MESSEFLVAESYLNIKSGAKGKKRKAPQLEEARVLEETKEKPINVEPVVSGNSLQGKNS